MLQMEALMLCIGERSIEAGNSVIKLEIKFVKNSIKLMYRKILPHKEIRKSEQWNESAVKWIHSENAWTQLCPSMFYEHIKCEYHVANGGNISAQLCL